jgi:Ion transport protein
MNEIIRPPEKTFREKMNDFMSSKFVEMFMILLIVLYMLLVLVNVFLDNNCDGNSSSTDETLQDLLYVEIVLVSIFLLEIFLKVYAMGIKVFFKIYNFPGIFQGSVVYCRRPHHLCYLRTCHV